MSKRPIQQKQIKQVRKLVRQTPVGYIDLIQWLRDRGHAQTAGAARKLIAAGRVQSESHPLGLQEIIEYPYLGDTRLAGHPRVPASLRDTIVVRRPSRKA